MTLKTVITIFRKIGNAAASHPLAVTGLVLIVALVVGFNLWLRSMDRTLPVIQAPSVSRTGAIGPPLMASRPSSVPSFHRKDIASPQPLLPTQAEPLQQTSAEATQRPTDAREIEPSLPPRITTALNLFQDRVLTHTSARRVRVETKFVPVKAASSSPSSNGAAQQDDPNSGLPGYVAFTIGAEAFNEQGVKSAMEAIATEYLLQFPDAPYVRVALVVGGGVRTAHTFKK